MNTVSLVTGAARGLGRTTAMGISRHGGDVISTYREGAEDVQAFGVTRIATFPPFGDPARTGGHANP